jgi:hypothetical protein
MRIRSPIRSGGILIVVFFEIHASLESWLKSCSPTSTPTQAEDNFKEENREHGGATGDHKRFAAAVASSLRSPLLRVM